MKFENINNIWLFSLILLLLNACSFTQPSETLEDKSILEQVKERGKLNCGISGNFPGFSTVNLSNIDITKLDNNPKISNNIYQQIQESAVGFDVDICRAIASAIFDNPNAVEYRFLDTTERFEAISSGNIDVLSRNTTWTVERDVSIDIEFAPIVFYDGQGILVRKNSEVKSLNDLNGKVICVQIETTTEENLEDEKKKRNLTFKIRPLQDANDVYRLYEAGECQAVTSDRSQLAGQLTSLKNPDEHIILPEILSKEPLAPVVINSDPQWIDIVRWIVFTLIEAEELGINQNNLEQMKASKDPKIIRFLGLQGTADSIGSRLGLESDYAQRIIRHVGNYGEIYNRNLGPNSSTPIPRGLNNLWNNPDPKQRGLIYSPPFR
ncbi:MAG: amino acid ABC transporter substrate-binding protein [Okeania sp. SIO3I5]|uniref:amino acid ABC transporter substrate-binding protein n=1 Tax=Okeania sp. SIO3I5 TaxID=2607805 RepID=UPI0013B89E8E|nr:amino acid ABC transporter substrate-binding protein [Okeania sp. SIO3I5]NEQ38472.1 amino acid ABC transporter substrate-binding protein [Okeania sp. SIO3I5]